MKKSARQPLRERVCSVFASPPMTRAPRWGTGIARNLSAARRQNRSPELLKPGGDVRGLGLSMHIFVALAGLVLLFVVLWDAFETVILPRRVMRAYRLARLFFRTTWLLWRAVARKIFSKKVQQSFLSYYGPLSLLLLFGIWAAALILAFGMLQWAAGPTSGTTATFRSDVYLSGSTFFTLGMGDVTPATTLERVDRRF